MQRITLLAVMTLAPDLRSYSTSEHFLNLPRCWLPGYAEYAYYYIHGMHTVSCASMQSLLITLNLT